MSWLVAAAGVAGVAAVELALALALIPPRAPAWLTLAPLVATALLVLASIALGQVGLLNFDVIGTLVCRLVFLGVAVALGAPLLFGVPFAVGAVAGVVVAPCLLLAFVAYRRVNLPWVGAAAIVGAAFACAKTTVAVGWALLLCLCVAGIVHTALAIPKERRRIRQMQQENLSALLRALAAQGRRG